MDDLISRQTAISAICNACGKIDCDKMDKCEKLQLPPANSSEFPNSSDCISRQAAIDALHMHLMYRMGTDSNKKRLDEWINSLPSAQPEYRLDEWCTDCKEYDTERHCCPRFNQVIRTTLNEMKSERKKGKWETALLDHEAFGVRPKVLYCSECNQCIAYPTRYCPNCGADMRGE